MKKYTSDEIAELWDKWAETQGMAFPDWLESQETPNKESSIRDSGSNSEQECVSKDGLFCDTHNRRILYIPYGTCGINSKKLEEPKECEHGVIEDDETHCKACNYPEPTQHVMPLEGTVSIDDAVGNLLRKQKEVICHVEGLCKKVGWLESNGKGVQEALDDTYEFEERIKGMEIEERISKLEE